ncbi:MAG: tyrosine-type recombinase/integrase [Planctomycetaceae bacterium]
MSREPKPYFKKQQQRWVCTIDGKRITLGADKKTALEKFHQLMLNRETVHVSVSTVYDLTQSYLDWCQANRKATTYDLHKTYLQSLIESCGKQVRIGDFKVLHITKWIEGFESSSTTKHNMISIVQRMFNWAVEQQYLAVSPIQKIVKPRKKRRDVVYTPDQWAKIKAHSTGSFTELLHFLWLTGCRPREARIMTANHIHESLVIFPPDQSKGETDSRIIHLIPEAKTLVDKQVKKNPTGPLFLNSRGVPWTKDSIKCRMTRFSTKVGFRVIAYGTRHSFATNALIRAVDTVSLSHLMGHKSTKMLSTYAHLAQNIEFLQKQARNAAGLSEASSESPPSASEETD